MLLYLSRRVVSGLVTLFGITIVSFGVIQLAPGDPATDLREDRAA